MTRSGYERVEEEYKWKIVTNGRLATLRLQMEKEEKKKKEEDDAEEYLELRKRELIIRSVSKIVCV